MRAAKRKTKVQPSQVKCKQYQQVRKENLVGDMYTSIATGMQSIGLVTRQVYPVFTPISYSTGRRMVF